VAGPCRTFTGFPIELSKKHQKQTASLDYARD